MTFLLSSSATTAFLVPSMATYGSKHLIMPSSSSLSIAPEELASDLSTATTTTFEPILPDGSVLMGMISIIVLSGLAFYVWQEQVVPLSRTKLALSKRNGAVKQYLNELAADEEVTKGQQQEQQDKIETINTNGSSRKFEKWLFTDWLIQRERKVKGQSIQKKEPALPILKDAKWNSGDNPVLAATGLIGICVLLASLTERIFQ